MSKLTDCQLEAAIRSSVATSNRHLAKGRTAQANAAARRAEHNEEELRERRRDAKAAPDQPGREAEGQPGAAFLSSGNKHAPRDFAPLKTSTDYAAPALEAAAAMIEAYGPTSAIRAMHAAIGRHTFTSSTQAMDISDGCRLNEMLTRIDRRTRHGASQ